MFNEILLKFTPLEFKTWQDKEPKNSPQRVKIYSVGV